MTVNGNSYYDTTTLAQKLAAAVAEYKDSMLRGLNAMCDDEKAQRIADFKAKFEPTCGNEEKMAAFLEKLLAFKKMLAGIQDNEHTESLITVGGQAEEKEQRSEVRGQIRPFSLTSDILDRQLLQTQSPNGLAPSYEAMTLNRS
jgi:hypothetical protein